MKIIFKKLADFLKRFWNWLKEKGKTHVEILTTIILDAILIVLVNRIIRYAFEFLLPIDEKEFHNILKNILHTAAIASLIIYVISDLTKSVIKNYKNIRKLIGCKHKKK